MIRKKPITTEAALLRMADLCARAEHCGHEIREKLKKMALPSSEIEKIIEYLEENRYIDDSRFAVAYARDKVRFSAWGRNKIRMALAMKHIPSDIVREALENIGEEGYMTALMTATRAKAKNLDLSDRNDYIRLYRHLASRGFESQMISKAIIQYKKERRD